MLRLIKLSLALGLLCLLVLPAAAFAPDDEQLAEAVKKNYGPMKFWEAEMTFPDYPDVKVHLWYSKGKWRQEWLSAETAESTETAETAVAVGRGGTVLARCTEDAFPLSPMFVWMTPNPVETWSSWGVDNTKRSFGFCDGQPCYLYGADPGDETSPMVQLNNENMAPILVRFRAGDSVISVHYTDYRKFGGYQVPQTVTVTMGGDHVLKAAVKWIKVNRGDDQELYARDGVDSPWCGVPPSPFDILRDSFKYPQKK